MNSAQSIGFFINFLIILGDLITYAIIARVLISWFTIGRSGPKGKISQVIYDITDPVLNVVKKIPHKIGMIDLSPLIAIIGIDFIIRIIIFSISNLL